MTDTRSGPGLLPRKRHERNGPRLTRRWKDAWIDESRVLSLVAVPAGWKAITHRPLCDRGEGDSIYDVAWVEDIPCFALVEEWGVSASRHNYNWDAPVVPTGRTFFAVRPVLRQESSSFAIQGETGIQGPELVLGPSEDPTDPWVLKRVLLDHIEREHHD